MRTARWRPASFAPRPSRLVRARGQGRAQASGLGRRLGLSAPYDGSVACAALTAAIAMAAIASSAHRRRTTSPPRAGSVDCATTMVAPEASAAKEKEESSTEVSRGVWPLRAGAGVRVGSGWRTWLGRVRARVRSRARAGGAPGRKELRHERQREGVAEDVEADERGHCAHAPAAAAHDLLPAADRCRRQWLDSAQLRGCEAVDRARAAECWSPGERPSAGHAVSSRHQR